MPSVSVHAIFYILLDPSKKVGGEVDAAELYAARNLANKVVLLRLEKRPWAVA